MTTTITHNDMFEQFEVPSLLVLVTIAIATGGLIGLERERRPDRKFAGLRTLALLCGAGPIVVAVADAEGTPVFLAIYLGLAAAIAVFIAYIRFTLSGEEMGFTTSITVFLVALLGVLVGYGRLFESTSIAIVTAFLLVERERLHGYVDSLTDEEVTDSLKLGALVFILYPVLPAEPVDPYGIVVLREVALFAIFVLLIEFVSYVLMRQLGGSTGLALTGLLAGGANSLATAGVMARIGTQSPAALNPASFGLILATASMILRNVGIAVVLAVPLFALVWQPALAMLAVTGVAATILWYRGEDRTVDVDLDSPFSFRAAAKFSVAYVAILVLSVGGEALFGDVGLYVTAFAGGLVSSAAVSVSAATVYNSGTVGVEPAVGMVVLGITASLTSKILLVEFINREMRLRAGLPMALVGLTGLVVFLLL